jgi:glycosyltransferase involved in cell wall biosynthesis
MPHGPYTIGIDCRLSGSTHAGIGRYIENLITRLPFDKPDYRWVLFFYHRSQVPLEKRFQRAVEQGTVTIVFAPIKHYSLAEQFKLPATFNQHQLDLLHVPHFNAPLLLSKNTPLVLTIHDLLWHQHRGTTVTTLAPWKYWLKYVGYRLITTSAISRAKALLVPSQAVKDTVSRYYHFAQGKIKVTYEGATDEAFAAKPKLTTALQSKTLLYVGSLYPHKNVNVVLKALKQLPDFTLEVAGSRSVFRDALLKQATELGVTDQVKLLGFVPDHQLRQKYQTCLALVQPSLSEGFGLTGLEAMVAGGAVIASDIPVFKEIYQDGAVYFDPHSADALVAVVTNLVATSRTKLVDRGQRVAQRYSWQTMADQTLAVYQTVLTHEKNS